MIPGLKFDIDLGGLDRLAGADEKRIVRVVDGMAMMLAEYARGVWLRVAQGLDVRHTGEYIRGIQDGGVRRLSAEDTPTGRVVTLELLNSAPHAGIIEEGHPAFSLAARIRWGSGKGSIKRSKDGSPYLHIPMRHHAFVGAEARAAQGTTRAALSSMMPEHIYKQAQRLQFTTRRNVGPIYHARGTGADTHAQFIQRDRYNRPKNRAALDRSGTTPSIQLGGPGSGTGAHNIGFEEHRGSRMVGRDRGGAPLINPAWATSKYHGLIKTGSKGHAQYMTIRTITPSSPGWNIPAQRGLYIARRVAAMLQYQAADGRLSDILARAIDAELGGGPSVGGA